MLSLANYVYTSAYSFNKDKIAKSLEISNTEREILALKVF